MERDVVQPDVVVVCDPSKLDERGWRGAPDWIIEVLSGGTLKKDLTLKHDLDPRHESGSLPHAGSVVGRARASQQIIQDIERHGGMGRPKPMKCGGSHQTGRRLRWESVNADLPPELLQAIVITDAKRLGNNTVAPRSAMAACRSTILAFTAMLLTGSAAAQSDFIDLGKSRVIIVKIPAGTFAMGSDQVIHADDLWTPCPACSARNEVERPVHQVTISRDFWMGQFDVTQRQWQDVMGNNPSRNRTAGPDAPVEQVSWKDVQSFLAKANALQTRWTLRLPTEAEWEYAARAGSTGEAYGPLDAIAWYRSNAGGTTHRVGQKTPNGFGLYDMLGNVWQWCQGWFGPYPSNPVTDPQGAPTGDAHPTRGGCYYCDAVHERAARRNRDLEDHSSISIGFRIVAIPRQATAPK